MEHEADSAEKIKTVSDAIVAITQAVPIYEDGLRPAVKEVGTALATIGAAINVALAPLRTMVWGYDQIESFLKDRLSQKLNVIPPEKIQTPAPNIAGPAVEALRFAAGDETLREMYAQLLATAMDKGRSHKAHPSFVEIIKQLTAAEARMIEAFIAEQYVACIEVRAESIEHADRYRVLIRNVCMPGIVECGPDLSAASAYVDNLHRLGLIQVEEGKTAGGDDAYNAIEANPVIQEIEKSLKAEGTYKINIERKIIIATSLGTRFREACVPSDNFRKAS